jgi:hypothetical protein
MALRIRDGSKRWDTARWFFGIELRYGIGKRTWGVQRRAGFGGFIGVGTRGGRVAFDLLVRSGRYRGVGRV